MGCGNSTPVHPSIYNETVGKHQHVNGVLKPTKPVRETNPNHMTGDYSQFQVAKHKREKSQKDRQIKVFMAADELSGRLLEEREMLSLGTRSRGTSRNTSRGASPTGTKRNQEQVVPMTPVTEDRLSRGTSMKSEAELPHLEDTPKKKLKKHKHSKSKGKKHRKGKKSKKDKDKSFKDVDEKDNKDNDSGVDEEDNGDYNSDDSDKENENIETVTDANDIRRGENGNGLVSSEDIGIKHNTPNNGSPSSLSKHSARVKFQSASNDSGIALSRSSNTAAIGKDP